MSATPRLVLGQNVEFEVDADDEMSIEFPQDFGDLKHGIACVYLRREEAAQLQAFLSKWLSNSDVCLHEAGAMCVCRKCGQTVNYGVISPSSLGVELGLASVAMFEEQKEVYRALRRMEYTKICAKCGQDPYDGHDMCTGNEANAPKVLQE